MYIRALICLYRYAYVELIIPFTEGKDIMKFRKLICLLTALCVLVGLAACGGETKVNMDNSGVVGSTNGGFLVETGDYVYFINGVESYYTTYKTGEVTKGALMRVKKSELDKIGTADWDSNKCETVVSKLMVSGDHDAGVYIYGDYVYYAVPSTEKDTTGTLKNSVLNFFRTKLDGTSTSAKIASEDFSNSAKFRFIQKDGKVYLIVYGNALYVYDADARSKVFSYTDTIDELVFDDDNGGSIYFTMKPINENLYDPNSDDAQQEKYHELWKYTVGDKAAEKILSGVGKYTVGGNSDEAISLTGVTIDLLKYVGGKLYFSYTSLDSTVASTNYVYIEDGKKSWNDAVVLNYGDKNASSIFGSKSYYYAADKILFIDSTYGLMVYDYKANSLVNSDNPDYDSDYGLSVLYYSDIIVTSTISEVIGDYLYVYDASNIYYRINLKALFDGEDAEEFRINALAMDSSWYKPEVVKAPNGHELFVGVYTDSVYDSYCYAIDVTALEEKYNSATDDEKDTFYDTENSSAELKAVVSMTLLGKMDKADNDAFESYYESLSESEGDN